MDNIIGSKRMVRHVAYYGALKFENHKISACSTSFTLPQSKEYENIIESIFMLRGIIVSIILSRFY